MDGNEDITGKGLDFMSLWQQHYYTWSTKSLSGNKVGLGIVAASNRNRDSLRLAGTEGAKSEPCRQEEDVMIERMNYSAELKGVIRTGSIPSSQGVDQRNNKFVHIYTASWGKLSYPEDYLCSLAFDKNWHGEEKLKPISAPEKKNGRAEAIAYVKKYNLQSRLSQLCYDVYHCILTSEKPLLIIDETRKAEDFSDFSREMMILIHYLLPEVLRKDGDYVSYVNEMSQEAHFFFSNQSIGKYSFSMNHSNHKRSYTLLEKEFFDLLAAVFMKENEEFDEIMSRLQEILTHLVDKRNQLEKCILTIMAPHAGKQKQKDDFFVSMERLMYWARKDASLLPALNKCIEELDYQNMKEEYLYAYTKLMITGAGGETKNLVFQELNQMLNYYYQNDMDVFRKLIFYIRDNHGGIYEELINLNGESDGFAETVIFEPIDEISDLEYAVKYHKLFFTDRKYVEYLVKGAYTLFRQTSNEKKQDRISSLAKQVNEELFVHWKKKDVENVVNQAGTLKEYMAILSKMNMERLEQPIQEYLYQKSVVLLKNEKQILSSMETQLTAFASAISMSEDMKKEILNYYKKKLSPHIQNLNEETIVKSYFCEEKRTEFYGSARNTLFAEKYLELINSNKIMFGEKDIKEWIRFVLAVTKGIDTKTARTVVSNTKHMILKTNRLDVLANANHTLKQQGTAQIHCPESLWEEVALQTEEDFQKIYENIEDITIVRCENSDVYQHVKALYQYANGYKGTIKEKTAYAWKEYEKKKRRGGNAMEENRFREAFYYAMEDILSKSIWAVLLGFYGFLFVTIREEVGILISYNPSVLLLIVLVVTYVLCSFFGNRKKETPGAVIYVMGIAVLLMNWGLALDTVKGMVILFAAALILSLSAKVIHYIFFIRQEEDDEDED